jgi:hypothetical protein
VVSFLLAFPHSRRWRGVFHVRQSAEPRVYLPACSTVPHPTTLPRAPQQMVTDTLILYSIHVSAIHGYHQMSSVSPANRHSANFSTITITYHLGLVQLASSGRSTKRLSLTPLRIIKKMCSELSLVMTWAGVAGSNRGKRSQQSQQGHLYRFT